jgi:hypothetical protein
MWLFAVQHKRQLSPASIWSPTSPKSINCSCQRNHCESCMRNKSYRLLCNAFSSYFSIFVMPSLTYFLPLFVALTNSLWVSSGCGFKWLCLHVSMFLLDPLYILHFVPMYLKFTYTCKLFLLVCLGGALAVMEGLCCLWHWSLWVVLLWTTEAFWTSMLKILKSYTPQYLLCYFTFVIPWFCFLGLDIESRRMNGSLGVWMSSQSTMFCLLMQLFQLVLWILHVLQVSYVSDWHVLPNSFSRDATNHRLDQLKDPINCQKSP